MRSFRTCARGLGDPLLVVSDGATGIIKAVETCFPRSARQRHLAHHMRNLAVKVSDDLWPEFKTRVTTAYQAPSRAIARDLAACVVSDYEAELPSAIDCFRDDFEACIAHLRMPITHRRAIRLRTRCRACVGRCAKSSRRATASQATRQRPSYAQCSPLSEDRPTKADHSSISTRRRSNRSVRR